VSSGVRGCGSGLLLSAPGHQLGDIQGLGLLGSRLAVVLPLIGLLMPFGVFWMRAHFVGTETALTEAGQLDGGST
jgi:raffinose/stachyose/melibiose transport system permease protein